MNSDSTTEGPMEMARPVSLAAVVMHLASCHDAKLQVASNAHESSGESQVPANAIPLQLDEESIFSEQRPTAFGELARRREPCGFEGPRQQPALPVQQDDATVPIAAAMEIGHSFPGDRFRGASVADAIDCPLAQHQPHEGLTPAACGHRTAFVVCIAAAPDQRRIADPARYLVCGSAG